jgi:ParB family chromosome partitioning protein
MKQEIIYHIPIDQIICNPQARQHFAPQALAELAETIREVGVQQPIRVRTHGSQFMIITGERRYRATRDAGLQTIPAIVVEGNMTSAEILLDQLIENLQRSDLSNLEMASAIERLMGEGKMTAAQAATKLGLSNSTVTRLLSLLTLPESIRVGIETGTISLSGAYELSQIDDPMKQAEFATQMAAGQLTRDQLSGVKRAITQSTKVPPGRAVSRATAKLDNSRSITIAGEGLATIEQLIEWLEELLGKARKAQPQGLALGTFLKMLKDQAKA